MLGYIKAPIIISGSQTVRRIPKWCIQQSTSSCSLPPRPGTMNSWSVHQPPISSFLSTLATNQTASFSWHISETFALGLLWDCRAAFGREEAMQWIGDQAASVLQQPPSSRATPTGRKYGLNTGKGNFEKNQACHSSCISLVSSICHKISLRFKMPSKEEDFINSLWSDIWQHELVYFIHFLCMLCIKEWFYVYHTEFFTNFTLMSHFLEFTPFFCQIGNIANIVWWLFQHLQYRVDPKQNIAQGWPEPLFQMCWLLFLCNYNPSLF